MKTPLVALTAVLVTLAAASPVEIRDGRVPSQIRPGSNANLCLSAVGCIGPGTEVELQPCSQTAGTKNIWLIVNWTTTVQLNGTDLCLDLSGTCSYIPSTFYHLPSASGWKAANGQVATLATCKTYPATSPGQNWLWDQGRFRLGAADTYCLDNRDGKGQVIQIWECNPSMTGNPNQVWTSMSMY
ncbi:uncharacterized protein EHS24_006776 [Apiotrichum porosum]|uniref:Ricin B lectin domain-containing protein n=1 Tax=Apiotrichum porosum TaxID=105984 RepID=A0A427XW74_9TREE|nr:uncharacterized protein EHS24_006776 [Apiotrichum porosum]RSH83119.1 hypothetical protein EHS24_006776 [Apiotrichum porosum]